MTTTKRGALRADINTRVALALIAAFTLARLVLATTFGQGFDEAYTIVIARRLDLSYFDHPPLHQWIAHFAALAFGEGVGTRLPFVALFAATGWMLFVLTRRLYDARAGLVALIALNLSPFLSRLGGRMGVAGRALAVCARRRRPRARRADVRRADARGPNGRFGSSSACALASLGFPSTAPRCSRSVCSPFSC